MTLLDVSIAELLPLHTDAVGVIRVGGTRVTLDTIISVYENGASPEEIVLRYDVLSLADVHAVISYYLRHRSEVTSYLHARQEHAEQVRQENETRFSPLGVRERLLARRDQNR